MSRITRMVGGAILGGCFATAVGIAIAGAVLAIALPSEDPMDRARLAVSVLALTAVGSALVGLVSGAASRASAHEVPLLKSIMVVGLTAILAVVAIGVSPRKDLLLVAAFGGVILGGILAGLLGANKHPLENNKKQDNAASKV